MLICCAKEAAADVEDERVCESAGISKPKSNVKEREHPAVRQEANRCYANFECLDVAN